MKCVVCGKEIAESRYMNAVLCSSKCFNVHFWQKIIAEKDHHVIVNGKCYCNGGNVENPNRYMMLGFGGRRFWIRYKDGRTETTNNLWYNGEVPDEFSDQLPDNAEFYWPEHIKFANTLIEKQQDAYEGSM